MFENVIMSMLLKFATYYPGAYSSLRNWERNKTEMALRMPGVQHSTVCCACSLQDELLENDSVFCSHVANPFSQTHQVLRIFQTPDWTFAMKNYKEEKVRQLIYQKQSKYNNVN